jgi:predicted translin family RNA/ssDNA-binding protein
MSMFEGFRAELDEHHDRRERIIKASRDITASSKKMYRENNPSSVPIMTMKH